MEEYSTYVAFLLIMLNLGEREEYDIWIIEYDLDIVEDLYYSNRFQPAPVYPTITV